MGAIVRPRKRSLEMETIINKIIVVSLIFFVFACPSEKKKKKIGDFCSEDQDCISGICYEQVCLDPDGDLDKDGLLNGTEKNVLKTDFTKKDTDEDGIDDGEEVQKVDNPKDTDGDGLIDAIESAKNDPDKDCLPDQFDPHNDTPDPATVEQLVAIWCQKQGVCQGQDSKIKATCEKDGSVICDFSEVEGYEKEEKTCDNKDNDCDGDIDEGITSETEGTCLEDGVCKGVVIPRHCDKGEWICEYDKVANYEQEEMTCDNLDNDCDGKTDEELESYTEGECPDKGVCAGTDGSNVLRRCIQGQWICQFEGVAGYEEVEKTCDGLDNDCDGDVDEDLVSTTEGQCKNEGVCGQEGITIKRICNSGEWVCQYGEISGYEEDEKTCDGLDNDCDGMIDENLVSMNEGECLSEGVCEGVEIIRHCDNGKWICEYAVVKDFEPIEMSCDGKDNDCDGKIDEDLIPPNFITCLQTGVCNSQPPQIICVDGQWKCDYSAVKGYEVIEQTCDELDNDCDGEIDEDLIYFDNPECHNKGVCEKAKIPSICKAGQWVCVYKDVPNFEEIEVSCDNLDNDCDGLTDEDLITSADGKCLKEGVCADQQDLIFRYCSKGEWICDYKNVEGYELEETVCDNLDNDCDGQTDEDLKSMTAGSCSNYGVCKGVQIPRHCESGKWVCDYSSIPGYENPEVSCDGKDNDCDGKADFGLGGEECKIENEFGVCKGVTKCDSATGKFFCLAQTPTKEICDEKDNNCDGQIDEGGVCNPSQGISGIVLDGTNKKPIVKAIVKVLPEGGCGGDVTLDAQIDPIKEIQTDKEGKFQVALDEGAYCLKVVKETYTEAQTETIFLENGMVFWVEITMKPVEEFSWYIMVCGHVYEAMPVMMKANLDGMMPKPIPKAYVTLFAEGFENALASTVSDENGHYCISGVPATTGGQPFQYLNLMSKKEGYFKGYVEGIANIPNTLFIRDIYMAPLPAEVGKCLDSDFEEPDEGWQASDFQYGVGWQRIENGLHINQAIPACVKLPETNEDCIPNPDDPSDKCAICAKPDQNACIPQKGALPNAYSGKWAYWFGNPKTFNFLADDGNCSDDNGGTGNAVYGELISPWFSLENVEEPILTFYSAWEIESVDPQAPPGGYDEMVIYAQAVESPWVQIGYMNPDLDANGMHNQCYSSSGLDSAPIWVLYNFDLSQFAGESMVRIKFYFSTDDDKYNGFRGWMIDRVQVLGYGCGKIIPE